MKLLIITQKIDKQDSVLGFFLGWVKEFYAQSDQITIICLWQGQHDLPEGIKVLSLGKEKMNKNNFLSKLGYILRFFKYIYQEKKNYDAVFVHMNQVYVLLGFVPWKIWHKKISLWYAHGKLSLGAYLAVKLSDLVFTSTRSGCRLDDARIKVVGQGIDTGKFMPMPRSQNQIFKIITIGRISPIKNYEILIEAVDLLKTKFGQKVKAQIIGEIGLASQQSYYENLVKLIEAKNLTAEVFFLGPVEYDRLNTYLAQADLFASTSTTGSLDKAMLEAMACGLPILTCNEALKDVLGDYREKLMFPLLDFSGLALKIKWLMELDSQELASLKINMRRIVKENHNLPGLATKILNYLK